MITEHLTELEEMKKKKLKTNHKRRKFLKDMAATSGGLIGFSALDMFLQSMMSGAFQKAYASDLNLKPRNYLSIQFYGAPSSWMYDLFLTPYGRQNFVDHPSLATVYKEQDGRYQSMGGYETVEINGLHVPKMWSGLLPAAGGGTRAMSDLLKHMLSFQGVFCGAPGHIEATKGHFAPIGAGQSLAALSPDASSSLLGALYMHPYYATFLSKKSKTATLVKNSSGNKISEILSAFSPNSSASLKTLEQLTGGQVGVAEEELRKLAQLRHPSAIGSANSLKDASQLIQDGFSDLDQKWTDLYDKYRDLMLRAIDPSFEPISGIMNRPVGSSGTRGVEHVMRVESNILSTPDLRDLIVKTGTETIIDHLPNHFAVAEYMITSGLSNSITLSPRFLNRLNRTGNSQNSFYFDQHISGSVPNLLLNTLYWRAVSACLLELISQLKKENLFKDTVIEMNREFARNARNDLKGADHGWYGRNITYYSGAFNGPEILGLMQKDDRSNYADCWGEGAIDPALGRQINNADVAATLAHLLRVPSPLTSTSSLIQVNDTTGEITPLISKSKFVSG